MNDRVGILLAAGRGRRMGCTKQLLPWPPGADDGTTIVSSAFDCLARVCDRLVVVLGHDHDAVVEALRPREFTSVISDPDAPMFESIRLGLETPEVSTAKSVLVHPADHPEIAAATLDHLLHLATGHPDQAIMPEYAGRGGHPVVLPAMLLPNIRSFSGEGGLRQFWIDHPDRRRRVPVDDPSVIRDLDTPDAYGQSGGHRPI